MHERLPHFPQSGTRDTGMSQAYMTESRETTKKTAKQYIPKDLQQVETEY